MIRPTRAAFVFLTRIPVGGFPYSEGEWRWAPAFFPVVGAALGALLALAWTALAPLGDGARAVLVLGLSMLLTGAFHEDGLADTFDALGGAMDKEKALEIMKDSRVGTFGAAALVVSIGTRAFLVARLGVDVAWGVPLALAAARVGPVWQMALLPHASPHTSRSKDLRGTGAVQAAVATALALAGVVAAIALGRLSPARALGFVAALLVVALVLARWYVKRVQGITGDLLGATEQVAEVVGLAALAWHSP